MTDQTISDSIYALAAPTSFYKKGMPCFAARESGLFRSNDGGNTWQDAYQNLASGQAIPTFSLALPTNFENSPHIFAGASGGVLRSSDGGRNWHTAIFPPPAPLVVSLVISPNFSEDNTLFAGTEEDGVFISTNGGVTWAAWNFGLLDMNILCLAISPDFARDETVFAGTTTGLFVSTNGGRTWREIELSVGFEVILSLAVSPHFANDHLVFAGTEEHGLFRSSTRAHPIGMGWEQVATGSLSEPINAILLDSEFPNPPDLLILEGTKLCISTDRGNTFQPWVCPSLAENFEIMAIATPQGFRQSVRLLVGGTSGNVQVVLVS